MSKMIITIQPFTITQKIEIFSDEGQKIGTTNTTIKSLAKDIFGTIEAFKNIDISKIFLIGPKKYCYDLDRRIREKEFEQYHCNKIEIEVL